MNQLIVISLGEKARRGVAHLMNGHKESGPAKSEGKREE